MSVGKTTNLDWGLLSITGTLFPYGIGELKGTAKQNFVPNWIGTGDVKVQGSGRGRTKPKWIGFVRNLVTGTLAERISVSEIGSGVLFNFSRADEAFTFTYEGSGNLYKIGGGEESVTTDYVATGTLAPYNLTLRLTSYLTGEVLVFLMSQVKLPTSREHLVNNHLVLSQYLLEMHTLKELLGITTILLSYHLVMKTSVHYQELLLLRRSLQIRSSQVHLQDPLSGSTLVLLR